jgi:hypothetical protein
MHWNYLRKGDFQVKKFAFLLSLFAFVLCPLSLRAQAPDPLGGTSVQLFVGYSLLQNAANSNGAMTSIAVPLKTINQKYSFTVAARADNFIGQTPAINRVYFGPEFRFQTSSTAFDGAVFQPFANVMAGAARSSCVASMTCAAGSDSTTHGAFKLGGGLDMVTSTHLTYRIVEIDYERSKLFPNGGIVTQNFASLTTGLMFTF